MNFQYGNNTSQYTPPQFSIMPPVCKNLLIINVICYLATVVLRTRGIDLTQWFGLHFFAASHHHIWQWLTYAFLHGNFSHLFFNMFAVWMFGYTLENIWGAKRFIAYCLVTILGAALMQEITYYFMYSDLLSGVYTYVNTGNERIPVAIAKMKIKGVDAEQKWFLRKKKDRMICIAISYLSGKENAIKESLALLEKY